MSELRRNALFTVLILVLACSVATAQDTPDPVDEDAPTSAIKKITISFDGGTYSGAQYFDLPILDDRAQLEEGTNVVTLFNNDELDLGNEIPADDGFAAPRKEIGSGQSFAARVGFYLNDSFHVDLLGSLAIAEAKFSAIEYRDGLPLGRVGGTEEMGWVDKGFKAYQGGVQLGFDAHNLKRFGLVPSFGMGFGGIINRFSVLEDKTALYFQLYGELSHSLGEHFKLTSRYTATTYSLNTEEVEYAEQVTTFNMTLGFTWLFDAKPIYGDR
jgi:hypothetical protein